jgi:integrase
MATGKIPYLLFERGRYYYQRKVPFAFHDVIGIKKWREPVGANHLLAVDRVRVLAKEHDALLDLLKNPDERRDHKARARRTKETLKNAREADEDAAYRKWLLENGAEDPAFFGEDAVSQAMEADVRARPWASATDWVEAFESERTVTADPQRFEHLIAHLQSSEHIDVQWKFPPFPIYLEAIAAAPERVRDAVEFLPRIPTPMDDDEFHDRLVDVLNSHFGPSVTPPSNPEDRDEFDLTKQRLERKIARVARSPDTITKVAKRYYEFAQIRENTQNKYRRTLDRLTAVVGDLPIQHLTASTLREYRDILTRKNLRPASIRADFTPIMGLLGYAVDEGLIDLSPMAGVKLPKERRAVEEMRWQSFEPAEMVRIFQAVDHIWGQPVQGVSDERRQALQMIVRALAYTAMRPAELMALRPDQVDSRCIRVEGGKTKSAWRVIPLHPAIADFPDWVRSDGLAVFANGETGAKQADPVTPIRHNFTRLIRNKMAPPIQHPKKALYSLRSTFQNALRRAGAPIGVRRALLGHVESGAIRHYDDGPEFEELKHWVELADPIRPTSYSVH